MRIANKLYDMTPTEPFYLIGYGDRFQSRREPAKGVHDHIYANVLLMEIDGQEYFIFNVDYIELLADFCDGMKKKLADECGIDPAHVLLSVTHNHQSVRDYHHTWPTGKYNAAYEQFLIDTILRSLKECRAELAEAEAFCGRTKVVGCYGNRLHPGEPADNEVILVEFRRDGKPVAGIVNWAVHSTVLSPENDLLTAEFAGGVRKNLTEAWGYAPLMIVGAAGDCSTRGYGKGKDFEELERVSAEAAGQIAKIKAEQPLTLAAGRVDEIFYPIRYDMRDKYDELNAELAAVQADPEAAPKGISPGFYMKCLKKKLAVEQVDVTLFSTVLHCGDVILVTIPGELGSKFGIELKALRPDKCVLILGYTNGFLNYMMAKEDYNLSMETIDSLYPAGSVEEYVAEIKAEVLKDA